MQNERVEGWGQDRNSTLFEFDNRANRCLNSSVLNPKESRKLCIVISLIYGEFENMMKADRKKTIT